MAHQLFQGVRRFRLTPFFFLVAYRLRIFGHSRKPVDRLTVCAGERAVESGAQVESVFSSRDRFSANSASASGFRPWSPLCRVTFSQLACQQRLQSLDVIRDRVLGEA